MLPSPLVPPVPPEELPAPLRAAYDRAVATRGDGTFVGVTAHVPELFAWYGEFYERVFYGGRVPVRFKELVRLRLSTLHGCAFCNRGNRLDAARAGLTAEQITSMGQPDAPLWSPAERAVLRLAGAMSLTNPGGRLEPALYAELRTHFDDPQIVELGMTMAVLAGMAKYLFVYDLVEKEDYCEFARPTP